MDEVGDEGAKWSSGISHLTNNHKPTGVWYRGDEMVEWYATTISPGPRSATYCYIYQSQCCIRHRYLGRAAEGRTEWVGIRTHPLGLVGTKGQRTHAMGRLDPTAMEGDGK